MSGFSRTFDSFGTCPIPLPMRTIALSVLFLVGGFLAGCSDGPDVADPSATDAPEWMFAGSSGGSDGRGYSSVDYDGITIHPDRIDYIRGLTLVRSVPYTRGIRRSIFSGEEVEVLLFSHPGGWFTTAVIAREDGANLTLSDNHSDGYSFIYMKPTSN